MDSRHQASVRHLDLLRPAINGVDGGLPSPWAGHKTPGSPDKQHARDTADIVAARYSNRSTGNALSGRATFTATNSQGWKDEHERRSAAMMVRSSLDVV